MIVQGILHLLTGFDHLAFLLVALLGVVRRHSDAAGERPLRASTVEAFKVITAFTVAHSTTLTLSALGVVMLAPQPLEATIAATVFVTAVSGFWRPTRWHGWPLAAAFGLVHGFGFAGGLTKLIGGETHAATTVGSFNLGVEIAQVAVALALVPLLYLITLRRSMERIAAPAISGAVAIVSLGWFIERIA